MGKVSILNSVDENNLSQDPSGPSAVNTLLAREEFKVADNELLIRKAFESDPKFGCELLYRHYYQALCSHATRFVCSKSIAEDIVSETILQFYAKSTYKGVVSSYRAFLYTSVRNKAYNYLRLEASRSEGLALTFNENPDAISQQPDSILQYEELCQEVESAINSLPAKCRKIYLMHRFEDMRYAEIAEELQLSIRTVEAQIRKASRFVKRVLSKSWFFLLLLCNTFC